MTDNLKQRIFDAVYSYSLSRGDGEEAAQEVFNIVEAMIKEASLKKISVVDRLPDERTVVILGSPDECR